MSGSHDDKYEVDSLLEYIAVLSRLSNRRFRGAYCLHHQGDERPPIIAVMMEALFASETSVHFNETTRQYIPEDCQLHTPQFNGASVIRVQEVGSMNSVVPYFFSTRVNFVINSLALRIFLLFVQIVILSCSSTS
jgi:hypothetical protein